MKVFTRGAEVAFENIRFLDEDGALTIPEEACLHIAYPKNQTTVDVEIALAADEDGLWSAVWDSTPTDPGIIYWHVRSKVPDTGKGAQEGHFRVKANLANFECGA